jgi:hypothetical protein
MKPNFNLNILKGRMAEQMIQDIFLQSNYNVFNYGLEKLHPLLSKKLKRDNHKTSSDLRFMPDFVVQSNENGDLFYLEVKFRADGCFKFDENYNNFPYKNAWFVIVSPQKIQCMHYKRLIAKYEITESTHYSLSKVKSFHINQEILKEYEAYARLLFQSFQNNQVGKK